MVRPQDVRASLGLFFRGPPYHLRSNLSENRLELVLRYLLAAIILLVLAEVAGLILIFVILLFRP